ncbi:type II toxin-antitoxin system RelE family toxin [Calderihabitans maritimus]|uniref:Uncharacterized protein n=1 Tax=Calderihabitans maritimus TaxID=1246530 RepID=A0A1Z5HX38_9FIRM|nr:hypothetical protein KKC1_32150 [Calderihabitans maritimus]
MYEIKYKRAAIKDIKKLDKAVQRTVISQIRQCAQNPDRGKTLHGNLHGLYSYGFTVRRI